MAGALFRDPKLEAYLRTAPYANTDTGPAMPDYQQQPALFGFNRGTPFAPRPAGAGPETLALPPGVTDSGPYPQPAETPAPAPAAPAAKPAPRAASPSPASATPGSAALPPAAASPAAPAAGAFTPVQTANPTSDVDTDLRIAHDMSRMLAAAGLGTEAVQWRSKYMGLQAQRYGQVADQVMREFHTTGDPSSFIAMHNHMVPNNRQITGYRREGDGFVFQTQDGKTGPKVSATDIFRAIETYKNPSYIGGMMTMMAKVHAESAAKAGELGLKHRYDLDRDWAKANYDLQTEMAKLNLKPDEWVPTQINNPTAPYSFILTQKRGNKTLALSKDLKDENKNPLPPQLVEIPRAVAMELQQSNGAPAPIGARPQGPAPAGGIPRPAWHIP